MHSYPALLCSCVVSILALCHGLPLPADTMRNLIKLQAENISARIQRQRDELPIFHNLILDSPELLPELPSDKPIEGLTSVVETLSAFQRVLHSLPKGHVTQLRSDVSKLQSDLEERMSSLQCPHRKTSTEKTLEAFLKNNRMFHITLGHVALDRLQKYLQRLTHNLDKLKTC
ncbi:leptin a [Astyanax mexicanus]|uniref:Leptin n=2 Tax=Astyanax mexicanus TaxID=7994 RepID=A0A3B1JDP4_ASTMX|nr:leptin a [Astyanax mexicanus]XP_049339635.1 leptin a [Astyanax mexicanus]KAG9273033.1 leptin [Astyanax mexicanus]